MEAEYHRLLKRQIKKHLGQTDASKNIKVFLEAVSKSYKDYDEDLEMLERSMTISSQELSELYADLNVIFQTVPDLFMKIDMDGKILDYRTGSSEELYLVDSERLREKRIQDVLNEEARGKISEVLQLIREKKSTINIEYALKRDEKEKFFEARFVPLNETQYMVIIREITDKKIGEKEMTKTLNELKQFKDVTVDRELKMIELKKEINQLSEELGRPEPYDLSFDKSMD